MVTNTQAEMATEIWDFTAFSRFRKSLDAEMLADRWMVIISYPYLQ